MDGNAKDASENDHDGTPVGVDFTAGKIRQAALFDAATDRIATASDWLGTGDLSCTAWVYLHSYGFAANGSGRLFDNGKQYFTTNASSQCLYFTSNPPNGTYTPVGSLLLNRWVHVAVTRTRTGIANFFIDGKRAGNIDQFSGTPAAGTTNVFIGNNVTLERGWKGLIDDERFYAALLSPWAVNQIYNLTK